MTIVDTPSGRCHTISGQQYKYKYHFLFNCQLDQVAEDAPPSRFAMNRAVMLAAGLWVNLSPVPCAITCDHFRPGRRRCMPALDGATLARALGCAVRAAPARVFGLFRSACSPRLVACHDSTSDKGETITKLYAHPYSIEHSGFYFEDFEEFGNGMTEKTIIPSYSGPPISIKAISPSGLTNWKSYTRTTQPSSVSCWTTSA
jgi:hypothetical protein